MSEFEKWNKINPLYERFIRYANFYNYGKSQKLKLIDVINRDLEGEEFFNLAVELALRGYKLRLIDGKSKYEIGIGINKIKQYSYFELNQSELLDKLNTIKLSYNEREGKLAKAAIVLEKENNILKMRKKAGQKYYDNKGVVLNIFDLFLVGNTMAEIAEKLNTDNVQTKRGGKWHRSTIGLILRNEEYVNIGFVSQEIFQKVNKNLRKAQD
jgi:hypothetical protein